MAFVAKGFDYKLQAHSFMRQQFIATQHKSLECGGFVVQICCLALTSNRRTMVWLRDACPLAGATSNYCRQYAALCIKPTSPETTGSLRVAMADFTTSRSWPLPSHLRHETHCKLHGLDKLWKLVQLGLDKLCKLHGLNKLPLTLSLSLSRK